MANYSFPEKSPLSGFSLPIRFEYIASTGNAANGAPNLAVRSRQQGMVGHGDADLSVQNLLRARQFSHVGTTSTTPGPVFGPAGTNTTQTRAILEAGILF